MPIVAPRFLICGAYSTGKTTAVEGVADRLRALGLQVSVCTDVARSCPLPLNQEQSVPTTMWLAAMQIRAEIEAEAGHADIVLCDRGLPDILSHHAVDGSRNRNRLATTFRAYARAWVASYRAVFWSRINPHVPIVADGLRLNDASYRQALEDALQGELQACRVRFEELLDDPEARVAQIEQLVLMTLENRGRIGV